MQQFWGSFCKKKKINIENDKKNKITEQQIRTLEWFLRDRKTDVTTCANHSIFSHLKIAGTPLKRPSLLRALWKQHLDSQWTKCTSEQYFSYLYIFGDVIWYWHRYSKTSVFRILFYCCLVIVKAKIGDIWPVFLFVHCYWTAG